MMRRRGGLYGGINNRGYRGKKKRGGERGVGGEEKGKDWTNC